MIEFNKQKNSQYLLTIEQWKKALELDPNNAEAKAFLER